MIRAVLERFLRTWGGPGLRIRYWDGGEWVVGHQPVAWTVTIRHPRVLWAMTVRPSVAFGEAYMHGQIEIDGDLEHLLGAIGQYVQRQRLAKIFWWVSRVLVSLERTSRERAVHNARHHYDLGNAFYRLWLDPTLTYSCAFFKTPTDDIATAQRQKLEVLCRKLHLAPGQTLLDIGCGWGSLLFTAAEHYGVTATGVTPSLEQYEYVQEEIGRRGLHGRCSVHLADWRECRGTYDRVVSVGMFEHVGRAHYREFLARWSQLLRPGGVSVLHTIGRMHGAPPDPWIRKYIFPGAYLPALGQIVDAAAAAGLDVRDVENLRPHYALTLDAWSADFARHRQEVVAMTDETFARLWWFYLRGSAAAFRYGGLCLWQIILTSDHTVDLPLTRRDLLP